MIISRDETKILKAISIISVILAHAYGWANIFGKLPVYRIIICYCQCGLALFFFLSGYGVYNSYINKGLSGYWDNKFKKIFIPAAVIQSIWLVVCRIVGKNNYTDDNLYLVFGDITCINPIDKLDGTMWFLSFIFFCYFSFFCIHKVIRNKRYALIALVAYWVVLLPWMGKIWESVYYFTPAFVVGVLFAALLGNGKLVISKNIQILLFLLLGTMSALYVVYYCRKNNIVDTIASIIMTIFMIFGIKLINTQYLKVFNWIGNYSFYVYLLEYKVIFGLVDYTSISLIWIRLIVFIVLLISTLIVSYIVKQCVDRSL